MEFVLLTLHFFKLVTLSPPKPEYSQPAGDPTRPPAQHRDPKNFPRDPKRGRDPEVENRWGRLCAAQVCVARCLPSGLWALGLARHAATRHYGLYTCWVLAVRSFVLICFENSE